MINTNSFTSNLKSNINYWVSNNRLSLTTLILLVGLIAFEMFNYSTTEYALNDLLGNLEFAGIFWSTILAIAFCFIDFAGIARLFIPGHKRSDIKEDWFLFGAWLLAATMNAILTWWGISMSLANHTIMSSKIVNPEIIQLVVPIFVAIMVWLTRILLIGSLTLTDEKIPTSRTRQTFSSTNHRPVTTHPSIGNTRMAMRNNPLSTNKYSQTSQRTSRISSRPEPEYVSDPTATNHQPAFLQNNSGSNSVRRF